jgi:predicted DNA-binding transcriptional regulator YafY
MKLYNLFKDIILEETNLLSEGISQSQVEDAINNQYNVKIEYRDYDDKPPSKRYIQVYNLSKTKAGNYVIRAYQLGGFSKTTKKEGAWKIFRLDRIEKWEPTKVIWRRPVSDKDNTIPKYNKLGDKTMSVVLKKVNLRDGNTTTS